MAYTPGLEPFDAFKVADALVSAQQTCKAFDAGMFDTQMLLDQSTQCMIKLLEPNEGLLMDAQREMYAEQMEAQKNALAQGQTFVPEITIEVAEPLPPEQPVIVDGNQITGEPSPDELMADLGAFFLKNDTAKAVTAAAELPGTAGHDNTIPDPQHVEAQELETEQIAVAAAQTTPPLDLVSAIPSGSDQKATEALHLHQESAVAVQAAKTDMGSLQAALAQADGIRSQMAASGLIIGLTEARVADLGEQAKPMTQNAVVAQAEYQASKISEAAVT